MNPLLIPVVGKVFDGLVGLIDGLHTSDEEKAQAKTGLFKLQAELYTKVMEFEARLVEAQSRIIQAEALSETWIAANWRPITMLTFVALVVNRWTGILGIIGLPPIDIPPEIEKELWTVIQLGLGGYVAGRSLEKIVPAVADVMKNKNG